MLNIGLKKHLESHDKLSGFCNFFTKSIFPECEIKVFLDETYKFFYHQFLPNCKLTVFLVLERDLISGVNFGSAKITVKCYVENKSDKSYFYYEVKPNYLSSNQFLNELKLNSTFLEFHTYNNILSSWNVIDDKYYVFDEAFNGNNKHKVISPFSIGFRENKFSLIPAIIKYENNSNQNFLKRYDFCIIISYSRHDFISQDEQDMEDIFLFFEKFNVISGDKETSRKITENKGIRFGFEDKFFSIVQSTENNKVGFFRDLENPKTTEASLSYRVGQEKFNEKIDKEDIKNILELWSLYEVLSNLTDFKSDMWKD